MDSEVPNSSPARPGNTAIAAASVGLRAAVTALAPLRHHAQNLEGRWVSVDIVGLNSLVKKTKGK